MEKRNMARDIVSEAVEQAEAMKKAAYENAKSVLVDAMSTNLKQAVTEAIDEKIDEAAPEAADSEEIQDEVATSDTDSIAEAGVEEEDLELEASIQEDDVSEADEVIEIVDEIDLDEDEDEEEIADDAYDVEDDDDVEDVDEDEDYGGNKGDESRSHRDYEAAISEEDDDVDVDVDVDDDEDDDDEDVDVDIDEDEDYGGNKGDESKSRRDYESAVRENKQLRKENKRYEKALNFLKSRIDEVNLFNARLAAAQDVMRKVSLTKTEKESVVESFDGCRTVGEVKRTFKVLAEAYKGTNKVVKKNRAERPNVQSVISEETKTQSTAGFDRMAELAGLK